MKILVPGYVGKTITGIGRYFISLVDSCTNPELFFVIYTNFDIKDKFVFCKNKNVEIKTYNISKDSSIKNMLWNAFVFPKIVKKEKANLVVYPNFSLILFKASKTICFVHDLIEFNVAKKFSALKMFYRKKICDPLMCKKADKIITVSQNSKKDIIGFLHVKENKIDIVSPGIDLNKFHKLSEGKKEEMKAKYSQIPEHFIFYSGTIDNPGKNPIGVIKAFELMRKNGEYSGKCVLSGMKGKGYLEVEEYAKQSPFSGDILFTGYISDEELIFLYNSCDVYCFVSLYEGFGMPPLEALACGAKVVVSSTSSLPEVVGGFGQKVDPQNIPEVARGILSEMHSKDYDVFALNSFLKNCLWEERARQFERCLIKAKK